MPEAFFLVFRLESQGAKACKSCRSRQELSNEYLLANIGVDTAENEPLEVWGENSIQYSLHSVIMVPCTSALPVPGTVPGASAFPERAASVKIKWKIKCS